MQRRRPCVKGRDTIRLGHRGGLREIGSGAVKVQINHRQLRVIGAAQLVDRSAPRLEVLHHLGRHLLRERVHPLRADPVVTGKDEGLRHVDLWHRLLLPPRHEHRQLLQPAQ